VTASNAKAAAQLRNSGKLSGAALMLTLDKPTLPSGMCTTGEASAH
jgi:hypothetical protein